MKALKRITVFSSMVLITSIGIFSSCSNDDRDKANNNNNNNVELNQSDKDALLFMLEEEKLARDTYEYLDNLWSINQFANIKISEQSHMNSVASLLTINNVPYNLLPLGEFANQDMQSLYDQFVIDGSVGVSNALEVGATIEDLDIKDLQTYIDTTLNTALIAVFESLQCGSRNHLRSFVSAIENTGGTYVAQYITQEQFDIINSTSNEQCN